MYAVNGDTLIIHSPVVISEKIRLSPVEEAPYRKEVITAGTVQAIPTQFAYIASPFPGRIMKSFVRLGQKVSVNTPLFEITSPDFTTVQKEFYQARSEWELARKEMKRKEDLLHHGVGSQRELEEAANALSIAEHEYENAREAIRVFQTDPDDMKLGQPLVIRSPIAGEIIENDVITGQYITSEGDPVAVVADLSKVWITAQVKEKDIRFIHEEDEMDIHISALPGKSIKGKVFHIEDMVDEETRSIRVLSICDNRDQLLKLGMYATVHFIDEEENILVIPDKALLQDEYDSYVFVQLEENKFIKSR